MCQKMHDGIVYRHYIGHFPEAILTKTLPSYFLQHVLMVLKVVQPLVNAVYLIMLSLF